jgi:diguanylate cyclase (GGDEF)-like protein/PAS domain S-box-containing protein
MSGHRNSSLDPKDEINNLIEQERLREENETLAQQIKQLVKAEGRLYTYQQELDAQLKEYKELYDLSGKLNNTFDIQTIFGYALEYIMHGLEYERAIFFLRDDDTKEYRVYALDGYYDADEKEKVSKTVINARDPILNPCFDGCEHIIFNQENDNAELIELSEKILMSEYVIYALGSHLQIPAILIAGNSIENAEFFQRVNESVDVLLGIGNLGELLSSAVSNHMSFKMMEKALEREKIAKAKYRGIFENASEGIIQLTPDGAFTSCNNAAADILGYPSPEKMPRQISEVASELQFGDKITSRLLEGLRSGTDIKDLEFDFTKKNGNKHWVLFNTRTIYSGDEIATIDGIILDVSERNEAREALQRAHDELEIRIKERTDELAKANSLLMDEILERTRIEEKLRELSEIDPLTMVCNRRKFFELITLEVEKCKRYNRPLSLIMYDLDNFKKINDEFGHQVGDSVLKTTSGMVSAMIRKVDVFARYGGDEFILLCPETGLSGALTLAERIKGLTEKHNYLGSGKVTMSIGVAELDPQDTVDVFIEKADKALYVAKKKGRNRVEIADADLDAKPAA